VNRVHTIKEIAQLAGVSRGTVDRVLNNRGAVNPETAKKVLAIVKALNYTPNLAGKTLAAKKKQLKFGYILFSSTADNPFFLDLVRGIEGRIETLKEYGATVVMRYASIGDPERQVALIDELLAEGINGLAITPINHPLVVEKLRELAEGGFPVVTTNSDVPDCGRLAYVGSNYYKSGETAAGLMNLICASPSGAINVGVILGSPLVDCHAQRVQGFQERVDVAYPHIRIVDLAVNNDNDLDSYSVTRAMLEAHSEIDALYLAAAGVQGACRAVADLGMTERLRVLCYDATESHRKLLASGAVAAAITQQPYTQGAKPLEILLDYAGMNVPPEREFFYTKIGIKIQENLETWTDGG